MTADGLAIVRFVFTKIWFFFISWHIPGTNVTPAGAYFFILVSVFVLRWIDKYFLGGED